MNTTKFRRHIAIAAALAAIAGTAGAAPPAAPEPAIPFANHGGIYDWSADRDQGLWVQDIHRQWYYAKLMGPCIGLNFAQTLGFDTHPLGRFDRFSAIVVPGTGRCVVQSLSLSDGPRAAKERAKQG
ncbi:MAG: DUF6491 family protein [Gammaproteobacteria bacterium]